jgi:hypothetical protein
MNLSLLELQRARKRLEAFCRQRNWSGKAGSEWHLSQHDSEFLISEYSAGNAKHAAIPLLRLCFDKGRWLLSVSSADGRWRAYPPRPEVNSIESVIEELEQAPLHVHWG